MHRERCEEYDPKSCLDDSCLGRALPASLAPRAGRQTQATATKLVRKYRKNPLAVCSNREAKTPSKTPQKRLLTALSKPYTSCTPSNSETKLRGRTAKPSYTSSNSETRIYADEQ